MKTQSLLNLRLTFALATLFAGGCIASAHCDGLDGPVVSAARKALEAGDVRPVLIWVQPQSESEIKSAFEKTLAVRKFGVEAKALADMYFFETLVRIHRMGEGAPYTGLQPAGRDLGPAILAADKAVEDGKLQSLNKLLQDSVQAGLHHRFDEVIARKKFAPGDTEAGREYVKAYVEFIHYVERLNNAATTAADSHSVGAEHQPEQTHKH